VEAIRVLERTFEEEDLRVLMDPISRLACWRWGVFRTSWALNNGDSPAEAGGRDLLCWRVLRSIAAGLGFAAIG